MCLMRTGRPTGHLQPFVTMVVVRGSSIPRVKSFTNPPKAMYRVRVSPDGAFIAVGEQEVFGGGPEWLTILDRHGAVVRQSKKRGSNL